MLEKIKDFFKKIAQSLWGTFESKAEIRKFATLAFTFFCIIGIYWAMRPIKDSVFGVMVGMENQPLAKIFSVCIMLPLVMLYTRLIDKYKRDNVFYILVIAYGIIALIFMGLFLHPYYGLENTAMSPYRLIGWFWYVYVESFGSLMVALFWVIVTDVTLPESAKRGFPLIYMFGQLGNIVGPLVLRAKRLGFENSAPIVGICAFIMFFTGIILWVFMRVTPQEQLMGYKALRHPSTGSGSAQDRAVFGKAKKKSVGFFEGLKMIWNHGYLLGILFIISVYEIVVTIFDFHFKVMAKAAFPQEAANAAYLAEYGVYTGIVASLCVLFGINNIQRKLGMFASLFMMPFLVAIAIFIFRFFTALPVVFWIMVFAKAVNYALNQPTIKQLYIPTTKGVRYKSQGWIEMFGARFAKTTGSLINLTLKIFTNKYGALMGVNFFLTISSSISFGLVILWLFVAFYLANKHKQAIENKEVVC